MHQGVQSFVRWVAANRHRLEGELGHPATAAEFSALEHQLGGPVPADLRLVLTRFNGGQLPAGTLLRAGTGPGTIEDALRRHAEHKQDDFLDPELPLPFHRTTEGSVLCFDRSAGPVSDTWTIVDYYQDTGETRLIHRTFDGWCRVCVAAWDAPDFSDEFSLDKYLRQGERHAALEPDVSSAHATVAHAYKRAGEPERALESYLRAARCVPPLPWCDWEALKIAVLLQRDKDAFEAASRLAERAPVARWAERETTPGKVADVISCVVARAADTSPWMPILDQLVEQAADPDDRTQARAVRHSLAKGQAVPAPLPRRPSLVGPDQAAEQQWAEMQRAYESGQLRDEDLLLDPALIKLGESRDLAEFLRIRREF